MFTYVNRIPILLWLNTMDLLMYQLFYMRKDLFGFIRLCKFLLKASKIREHLVEPRRLSKVKSTTETNEPL